MILSAIPASGKSTWAAKYQATHPDTYIVSSDQIRMEVTHGDFQDHSKQKEVWELFSQRIHECAKLSKDVTVILDALNDLNSLRIKYVKENPEFDRYVLVLFGKDIERSKHFNSLRPELLQVPEGILDNLISKFEPVSDEARALFDEVIEVEW